MIHFIGFSQTQNFGKRGVVQNYLIFFFVYPKRKKKKEKFRTNQPTNQIQSNPVIPTIMHIYMPLELLLNTSLVPLLFFHLLSFTLLGGCFKQH